MVVIIVCRRPHSWERCWAGRPVVWEVWCRPSRPGARLHAYADNQSGHQHPCPCSLDGSAGALLPPHVGIAAVGTLAQDGVPRHRRCEPPPAR